jgi:hypothetical protein
VVTISAGEVKMVDDGFCVETRSPVVDSLHISLKLKISLQGTSQYSVHKNVGNDNLLHTSRLVDIGQRDIQQYTERRRLQALVSDL